MIREVNLDKPEEDMVEESKPQDEQISSPEDDDRNDILKKIKEAGE